jgi:DNA mismatch repair ATPase MutS
MLATHFFEMFEIPNFLPQSDENLKCFNLSLHEDDEGRKCGDNGDETAHLNSLASDIVYLRTVVPGIAKKSYGYHCAMRAGIPLEIVERAVRVAEHIKGGTPIDSLQSNSMVRVCTAVNKPTIQIKPKSTNTQNIVTLRFVFRFPKARS